MEIYEDVYMVVHRKSVPTDKPFRYENVWEIEGFNLSREEAIDFAEELIEENKFSEDDIYVVKHSKF